MGDWSFLTNHARALLFIADDPQARLRDVAAALGVTERTAYGIVVDLTEAGYVVKEKDGRRNRYHIQDHLPLRDPTSRERTIGEVLDLLVDARQRNGNSIPPSLTGPGPSRRRRGAHRTRSAVPPVRQAGSAVDAGAGRPSGWHRSPRSQRSSVASALVGRGPSTTPLSPLAPGRDVERWQQQPSDGSSADRRVLPKQAGGSAQRVTDVKEPCRQRTVLCRHRVMPQAIDVLLNSRHSRHGTVHWSPWTHRTRDRRAAVAGTHSTRRIARGVLRRRCWPTGHWRSCHCSTSPLPRSVWNTGYRGPEQRRQVVTARRLAGPWPHLTTAGDRAMVDRSAHAVARSGRTHGSRHRDTSPLRPRRVV